jgi:ABC-type microcin C transport system duplicated ATPase subunit YejF
MGRLTRDDVIKAVGEVDDVTIAEIIGTGATAEELAEAQAWIANADALLDAGKPPPTGRVRELIDILTEIESEEDVEDVEDRRGETLGLVGESGSGKSTTGLAVLRMLTPTAGADRVRGTRHRSERGCGTVCRRMQMVYQDPYGWLKPRMTIRSIVREPLAVHGLDKAATRDKVAALIASVSLLPDMADRYPHEFSGGQRA